MIIIIVGGIGEGKTLTAVHSLIHRRQNCFTNFDLYKVKHDRLKYEHLFSIEEENGKKKMKLNFDFWKAQTKKGGFDVYLDEFHNVMNSRRSMSKKNVLLSDWLSQIRKILGQTEKNNLYLITQKLRRIDINSRDLAHLAILCQKQVFINVKIPTLVVENGKLVKKRLPLTMIYKKYFNSADALSNYVDFGINTCRRTTRFMANDYFKFFNSYELIDFGSEEYI